MAAPNATLYIHNLNDKISKDEMRLQLYSLFSTFGSVIDLVASKGKKMKGQAFLVFSDLASATAAMRSCEGMTFYDKPLRIEYAKTKSYATLKREDPEFVPPSALKAQSHPPATLVNRNLANGSADNGKRLREDEADDRRAKKRALNGSHGDDGGEEMEIEDEDEGQTGSATNGVDAPGYSSILATLPNTDRPPSNTLLCTNLPQEVSDDVLAVLFQQYRGFQTTHVAPSPTPSSTGTPCKMAQVLFDTADLATVAKEALDGFTLKKGWTMSVAFS